MVHNSNCEYAKSDPDKCDCLCAGKFHGVRERNNDRKDVIGIVEGNCLKCGERIHIVKKWHQYYCNNYCCSPCCPDAKKSPCSKEVMENESIHPGRKLIVKMAMRNYVFKFKVKQLDIRQKWSDVNGK